MSEEWRDVPGYEGWYQVSSAGRVRRIKNARATHPGKILRPAPNPKGYQMVKLFKGSSASAKTIPVHTLVAAAFLGPRPDGLEINHKDCIKAHNIPENLEYVTTKQNIHHAIKNGMHVLPDNMGSKNGMAKLNEDIVRYLRKQGRSNMSEYQRLGDMFGVTAECVRRTIAGKGWKHV